MEGDNAGGAGLGDLAVGRGEELGAGPGRRDRAPLLQRLGQGAGRDLGALFERLVTEDHGQGHRCDAVALHRQRRQVGR